MLNSAIDIYFKQYVENHLPLISRTADNTTFNVSDQSLRDKTKFLKLLPIEGIDPSYSRFVAIEFLNVYSKSNQKSQILDELIFGQVVIIVIKDRNWAEVAFRDRNGEIQQGWVFNRYLKKFN